MFRKFAAVLFLLISSISCVTVQPEKDTGPVFEEAVKKVRTLEKNARYDEAEKKVRRYLQQSWAEYQQNEFRYHLAWILYKKGRFDRALTVLEYLEESDRLMKKVNALGANAAFQNNDYEKALDFSLKLYPYLKEEADKIPLSRIIFLSYLKSDNIDKAAKWYAAINKSKRSAVEHDLENFFSEKPEEKKSFFEKVEDAEKELPLPAKKPAEDDVEDIEKDEDEEDVSPEIDASYEPDWNSLCVFLSGERKWERYNESVKNFIPWYVKEIEKNEDFTVNFMKYFHIEDIEKQFVSAKEKGCFAVAGPLFTKELAHEFHEESIKHSMPVISYSPWNSSEKGFFFNFNYTLDMEANDVVKHLISEDKKNYAILYSGTVSGREQRDVYWNAIEKSGGKIVDAIEFSPDERSFLRHLDSIITMPHNYEEVVARYKQNHAHEYKNRTLLDRAVERFKKLAPGQLEADVIIVLMDTGQTAMLIPAFSYMNVGLDYYSPFLKRQMEAHQKKLDKKNLDWEMDTVIFVPRYLVKYDARFIDRLNKHIEGMIISAPFTPEEGDESEELMELNEKVQSEFDREIYASEQILAEIIKLLFDAVEKTEGDSVADFYSVLKNEKFTSILTGREIYFDENNRLVGQTELYRGVKDRGFVPLSSLEKEEKEEDGDEPDAEDSAQNENERSP